MPGWCCCDYWEQWGRWEAEHYEVARESMRDQLRRLRNHASVFVFLYGSDAAPDVQAERMYLDVLAEDVGRTRIYLPPGTARRWARGRPE